MAPDLQFRSKGPSLEPAFRLNSQRASCFSCKSGSAGHSLIMKLSNPRSKNPRPGHPWGDFTMVMAIHYNGCKAKQSPHAIKANDGSTHTPMSMLCSWILLWRFPGSAVLSQGCWFQSRSIVAAPFLPGRQKMIISGKFIIGDTNK